MRALDSGLHPSQIHAHYCRHKEGNGVIAVDDTGLKGRSHVTRLYFFPDTETVTIHLITIGDKNTQKRRDIPVCQKFIRNFRGTRTNG